MPRRYGTAGPRAIYPSSCISPSLAACDPLAQLLFDRMLTQADDQGRLVGDPRVVKTLCMPLIDAATPRAIEKWLGQLAAQGMVTRYKAAGVALVQFVNWWDHQAGMKKSFPSRYPAPDGWTDRIRGLGGDDDGDGGGTSSPDGGTSSPVGGKLPPSPRAPSAAASAAASAAISPPGGGESGRAPDESRYGLPHVTPAVAELGERITGHGVLSAGDRQATELDRLVQDHGEQAVITAMRRFAGERRVSWRQLVWDGLVKSLEPFGQGPRTESAEERDARELAELKALAARNIAAGATR